jgi:hypothetical protein
MARFTKGTRFRSRCELRVKGIIVFGAPFSGGFEGVFPANEILILDSDPPPGTKGMWLVPERYQHFEAIFVPSRDREHEEYGGYAVGIEYTQVGSDVEVLHGTAP